LIYEDPKTYQEVISGINGQQWQKAMDKELVVLKRNNTFDIVPRPSGRKIIDCKWVNKVKRLADGSID
jgi:hypothetical protein